MGHCAYRRCALLYFRHSSIIHDALGLPPILAGLILPHTTKRATSSSSLGSDTSWHGGSFSVLCYFFSVCECVFRKIFVFVLHLLLSCAQNGSDSYCCVCSLGASLWRAGRETGCAFLYGVIAIGRSLSRDAFENWWATACWVLYTSKLSSSLLFWCSHKCYFASPKTY